MHSTVGKLLLAESPVISNHLESPEKVLQLFEIHEWAQFLYISFL